jgi:MFS family permease
LPVLLVGTFLFATDAFIVNVALPTIGRTLHAVPAYLELTAAGYVAAFACCLTRWASSARRCAPAAWWPATAAGSWWVVVCCSRRV